MAYPDNLKSRRFQIARWGNIWGDSRIDFFSALKTALGWTPKILATMTLALGVALYNPLGLAELLRLESFLVDYGQFVGPAFLLVTSLLIMDVAWRIAPLASRWTKRGFRRLAVMLRWRRLDIRQRTVLARMIEFHMKRIVAYENREEIQSLVELELLEAVGPCPRASRHLWWFEIPDKAYVDLMRRRRIIRRHLLATKGSEEVEETWNMLSKAFSESQHNF